MENLQGIINRYKDQLPEYHRSATGFLAWGGKVYYEINSDEPLQLNADSNGFILNQNMEVELFDISRKELVKRHYYEDEYHEVQTEEVTEYYWDETEPYKWNGKTLDNYYPWPWYPEKEIEAFEVVRIMPIAKLGDIIMADGGHIKEILQYPEFYRPIYK